LNEDDERVAVNDANNSRLKRVGACREREAAKANGQREERDRRHQH
jgi:hypothetical protein